MGDISRDEVAELNRVFFGKFYFTKGVKEPALLYGWNWMMLAGLTVFGWAGIAYGKFIKGYNILWFIAPFCPFYSYLFYNFSRQPTQQIENCYKYLLTKRAATCELEKNQARFAANEKL